ncbi:MAG: hypothetical protein Q4C12_02785 [Clostridia bacterium]|nr:hypothetical protein [Clostridia bacterium]
MKKTAALLCAVIMLAACGGSSITSDEAQLQYANTDLEASAEILNGFKAETANEAAELWRTAKRDGNGALMYALYSSALKPTFLERCVSRGSWKIYDEGNPTAVEIVEISAIEDGKYVVEFVTTRESALYSQIVIIQENGGYFIETESAEYDAPMGV